MPVEETKYKLFFRRCGGQWFGYFFRIEGKIGDA